MIVQNFLTSAKAEAQKLQSSLNYLNIFMAGAPLRYTFDHWLKTDSSDASVEFNAMTANSYSVSNGLITGVENRTFNYNGYSLPYLFSQSVNVSSGSKAISSLLESMLVIRGYGTGFDGHSFNGAAQMAPLGGAPSINGLVADNSNKIFEAIQSPSRGSYHAFTSKNGKAINILPINNPLPTLLEGFKKPNNKLGRNLKESQSIAFEEARTKLRAFAAQNSTASEILRSNVSNAEKMLKKGINNLDSYWQEALPRYTQIIKTAIATANIANINNINILSNETGLWNIQSNTVFTLGKDFNFQNSLAEANIGLLAEGLALTEYVLCEDLAQSIEILVGGLDNLNLKLQNETQAKKMTHINDMHGTGVYPNIFLMNGYYRGLTAGILELIDKLKNKDIWKKTMIQISSEFGRTTRTDLTGSDHGFNQMITSLISGSFTGGPYIVGNISNKGLSTSYSGTQGVGTEIKNYTQKGRPTPLMPASTIAQLLNVSSNPYVNLAAPLVKNKNGILVYEFGKGKITNA